MQPVLGCLSHIRLFINLFLDGRFFDYQGFFFFLPGEDIEFSRQFPFLYFRFRATLPTSSLSLLGKQGVVKQFLDWSCHYKKIHLSLLPLGLARVPLCPLLRIIHLLIAFTACLPFFYPLFYLVLILFILAGKNFHITHLHILAKHDIPSLAEHEEVSNNLKDSALGQLLQDLPTKVCRNCAKTPSALQRLLFLQNVKSLHCKTSRSCESYKTT